MSEIDQISSLIGDIYDATLDASRWPDVLRQCADYAGGGAVSLYSKDTVRRTVDINQGFGIAPAYMQSYIDKYVSLDAATTGLYFFGVQEVVATSDMMPYEDFLRSRFYREWAQPQQMVEGANVVLEKSASNYAAFTLIRHERHGRVDHECRHRIGLLVPHIRRAVLISKALELRASEAASLADTLDTLSAGTFLVDADGRLVHANDSGRRLLERETLVRAARGRLLATGSESSAALNDAFAASADGDAALGTRGIAVPLFDAAGEAYVAHVLPLTSGARRRSGVAYAAAAAIFVCKAQVAAPDKPEVIARLYSLTPSELRVLLALFERSGIPEITEALGISESTAKTHLKRLFEKTGCGRQADLVKLVAGFIGPDR